MAEKTRRQIEDALLEQLKNPFDPKFVKWRVGATNEKRQGNQVITPASKGIALAYIDSREVKKRLDQVCGISGWRDRLIPLDGGFICEIDIKINGEWVTRSNAADNTHIAPLKGGASDAFKRAASKWGIGHYLYYLPNDWVEVDEYKKLKSQPQLPKWALPGEVENWEDVAALAADDTSGVDAESVVVIIDNVDNIRAATTELELDDAVDLLSEDQKLILANQISMKRRELKQHGKIHADNS